MCTPLPLPCVFPLLFVAKALPFFAVPQVRLGCPPRDRRGVLLGCQRTDRRTAAHVPLPSGGHRRVTCFSGRIEWKPIDDGHGFEYIYCSVVAANTLSVKMASEVCVLGLRGRPALGLRRREQEHRAEGERAGENAREQERERAEQRERDTHREVDR